MELTGTPGQGYRLRQVDGQTAEFDGQGKIIAFLRPGPQKDSRIEFSYNSAGLLSKVTGVAGFGLEFRYLTGSNLIQSVVDHTQRAWVYSYDQHQNLVQVKDPFGRLRAYAYRQKMVKVSHLDEKKDTVAIVDRSVKGLFQVFKYRLDKPAVERIPEVTNQYTSEFRVFQQMDAKGGITRFDYNRFNRTTALTDPAGWSTLYNYDLAGNTTRIRKPEGGITEYIYDEQRNLVAEVDPLGNRTTYVDLKDSAWLDRQSELGLRAFGNRSDYVTVPQSEIIRGYDKNGNRPFRRDALGNTYQYLDYNRFGRPQRVILPTGDTIQVQYDERSGMPIRIEQLLTVGRIEPLRWIQVLSYDPWGNLVKAVEWTEDSLGHPGARQITEQEFDAFGISLRLRRSWIENETGQNNLASEEYLEWDSLGRLSKSTKARHDGSDASPEILEINYGYDVLDRLIWKIEPDQVANCFEYDLDGRLVATFDVEHATIASINHLSAEKKLLQQRWSYDLLGNPVEQTDPTGIKITRFYDECAQCTRIREATGFTTFLKYDRDGQEIVRRTNTGYELNSDYDQAGRMVRQKDSEGLENSWTYDALGRVINATQIVGEVISTTSYRYDALGRLVEIRYPDGAYERLNYEERGMLIRRERGPRPTAIEAYGYDGLGRLVEVKAGAPDHLHTLFSYGYNDALRCVETMDALGNASRTFYDSTGNLIKKEDAEGRILEMTYNHRGNLTHRVSGDHSVDALFDYDYAGRLVLAQEGEIRYQWEYDPAGRMITHHQQAGNQARQIHYTFDESGRISQKEIGSNWWMKYEYKPETPFVSKLMLPGRSLGIKTDTQGRVLEERWDNESYTNYSYLPNNLIQRKQSFDEMGKRLFGQQITFDKRMRRESEERYVRNQTNYYKYSYDSLDQINRIDSGTNGAETEFRKYEYDGYGNRLTEYRNGKLWATSKYDIANKLINSTDINGERKALTYDKCGNLINNGNQQFAYDAANRLRTIKNESSDLLEFIYSATNQHAQISHTYQHEWIVYEGQQEILSISSLGDRSTYWGFQIDQLLAFSSQTSKTLSPVVTDLLSSVIWSDNAREIQEYEPFGAPLKETENLFGFGGKRFFSDIGLYDNRARLYDPYAGRFIQSDPLGTADGFNLYLYAKNNPLAYLDELGLKANHSSQGTLATPSGKFYSVLFEVKLPESAWGASRYTHFKLANEAFAEALKQDPEFNQLVEQLIPRAIDQVERAGGRGAPEGWVWHHHASREGVMQLVPEQQHTPGSIFWETMHPDNKGGYSNWAIPAGAPPN